MLVACWSAKGGAGTTVVSCSLSLLLARSAERGDAVLVDLAGDVPATLGLAEPSIGVGEWLAAPSDVDADALGRVAVDAGEGLSVVGAGAATCAAPGADRAAALAAALAALDATVVVDCGVLTSSSSLALAVAGAADVSLLVVRPCYVSLRRAIAAPLRPDAVVLVAEPGRSLGRRDVEDVLGVEVRAELELDPSVARAVDAGLLRCRLPRHLERVLEAAA